MLRSVAGIIDVNGQIRLLEPVVINSPRRAIVTILDDEGQADVTNTAPLSEAALAADWNRPEEDEAWTGLKSVK
jgi:hypothetical protein